MKLAVLQFVLRWMACHVISYAVVRGLFLFLILTFATENFMDVVESYFRSPEDLVAWSHIWRWVVPIQVLRAGITAFALLPFYTTLLAMSRSKRILVLFSMLFILGGVGAYSAGLGALEGLLYLHPEVALRYHLLYIFMFFLETMLTALLFSLWVGPKTSPFELNIKP